MSETYRHTAHEELVRRLLPSSPALRYSCLDLNVLAFNTVLLVLHACETNVTWLQRGTPTGCQSRCGHRVRAGTDRR